jgi:hypothetical protein
MEHVGLDGHQKHRHMCLLPEAGAVWTPRLHTQRELPRFAEAGASRAVVRPSTTLSDAALTELEHMAAQVLS